MNDRLTFRFFNTKENKYMPAQYVDETTVFLLARLGGDKYIIEQCTGIKDKNGNLIYEGDIIAVANGSINGNVCISKWEVVWKEKEGRYSVPLWVSDKPDFSHYVKVLGNIHENTELLEDK